jgi:hypothetical protein
VAGHKARAVMSIVPAAVSRGLAVIRKTNRVGGER